VDGQTAISPFLGGWQTMKNFVEIHIFLKVSSLLNLMYELRQYTADL